MTDGDKGNLSQQSRDRHAAQQLKRSRYFLKGPIEFDWISANVPDPASRTILVAQAFMDMSRSGECVLDLKVWYCAGISDRYERRRVLKKIRKHARDYKVLNRSGRPSLLVRSDR